MDHSKKLEQKPRLSWKNLFLTTFLTIYLYVFMEWLFDVTKPSFMSALSNPEKLEIFLFTSAIGYALCFLVLCFLFLISYLPPLRKKLWLSIKVGTILPAAVLASVFLMLIDNFTYTIFRFGIITAQGVTQGLYGLLFVVLFAFSYRTVTQRPPQIPPVPTKNLFKKFAFLGLNGAIFLSLILLLAKSNWGPQVKLIVGPSTANSRPNILFISGDGVDATHTSVYGYERDTTPRIRELSETSLTAENAFPNSGNTGGSLTSFLTGKSPITTHVLYPPDILTGANAYQHLPGILKSQGYYEVQFGVFHYADAFTLNILNGFDVSNSRSLPSQGSSQSILRDFLPSSYAYFINDLTSRLVDRLCSIFYLKPMTNPYDLVTKSPENLDDRTKLRDLLDLLRNSTQPLFVQIHFLGTHGPTYYPEKQVFSAGQAYESQKPWNADFYDDSISNFDDIVGNIIDELKKDGMFDNSILVIGSDHGAGWVTNKRVPLVIHFPGGQYASKIEANVQNIDVAPTILDFMGVTKPDWMEGQSLLNGMQVERPIFGASVNASNLVEIQTGFFGSDVAALKPPFYQFGLISMVHCDTWYQLDLSNNVLDFGKIAGASSTCKNESEFSKEQAVTLIVDQLKKGGFDVSSLVRVFPYLSASNK